MQNTNIRWALREDYDEGAIHNTSYRLRRYSRDSVRPIYTLGALDFRTRTTTENGVGESAHSISRNCAACVTLSTPSQETE